MSRELPQGLIWYPDSEPGILRRRAGRGWTYRAPDGTTIDDAKERARIAALAVPPAYRDVWISPRRNGHLQATGRDAAERKQYRYHPDFAEFRARTKFEDLGAFGEALPRIRRRIHAMLQGEPDSRDVAVAATLRLIDRTSIRVGTPEYAAERRIYGATTLLGRHVRLGEDGIRLSYRSKGGQKVRDRVRDSTLMRALQRMDDLPGGALIKWQDDAGEVHRIGPEHVNVWLQDFVEGATAKTFRTWNGSAAALEAALAGDEPPTIRAMAEAAAAALHNTPAIARKSYIHPAVIGLAGAPVEMKIPEGPDGLRRAERALLHLLRS